MIILRGKEEHIKAAQNELKKILHGGEGFSVDKIIVPDSIVGAVIGKGGKNIIKYTLEYMYMNL